MRDIKAISNEEEHIFDAPDSLRGSDLGQGPADPRLDSISKEQSNTNDASESLRDTLATEPHGK